MGSKVLVVDDDLMIHSTFRRVLRSRGIEIDIAVGVQHALDVCRLCMPGVILTDIDMEDGTGFDLVDELRAMSSLPFPRHLMFMSGLATADRAAEAEKHGGKLYDKMDFNEIADAVADAIKGTGE